MKSIIRKSEPLEKPDDCSDERELFIDSHVPIEFEIKYYNEKAIELLDKSVPEFLPCLPWGYHWEKVWKEYGVYKSKHADEHQIVLIVYGPDEKNQINYNLLIDGNNSFTLSHTRDSTQTRLRAKDRHYPSPIKANATGYQFGGTQYMPGHCVDHVDSIIPPANIVKKYGADCISSFNPANYIPEVQKDYWGLYMRKGLVGEQRKGGCSYAQLAEYPDNPNLTVSGAAVPESVYFYCLDKEYKPKQVSWIDWDVNYNDHKKPKATSMMSHMETYSTSLEAAPQALIWDVNNSARTWRKTVRDSRILGHNIRKKVVDSYNPDRDQIYAYGNSSTLEYTNSYASISAALAASPQGKVKLTKENLKKAVNHGLSLLELDETKMPVDENRYKWVKQYHKEEKPGFEDDDLVDTVKQLTFN